MQQGGSWIIMNLFDKTFFHKQINFTLIKDSFTAKLI